MLKLCAATLLTVLACPVVFTTLEAGIFCGHPFGSCSCQQATSCTTCRQAQPCGCAATPQVSYRPRIQHVPQISYRDVTRTQYRTQAETQQVPITRYRNVAVDRGAWHKIWVPKVETQQVSETVYENRTTYRQVPYQVTQRVPQTTYTTRTTMVPTHSHVPVTAGCNTCAPTTAWSSYPAAPITASPRFTPHYAAPTMATLPAPPIASVPAYSVAPRTATADPAHADLRPLKRISSAAGNLAPVPDPKYLDTPRAADSEWTTVGPRISGRFESAPIRTSSASRRFVRAPSATSVLRTRSTRLR
jgi:hypothetical protein